MTHGLWLSSHLNSLWWICPTRTGRCCVLLERLPAQCDRVLPNSLSHARKSCHPRPEQRQKEGKWGHALDNLIIQIFKEKKKKQDYGTLETYIHIFKILVIFHNCDRTSPPPQVILSHVCDSCSKNPCSIILSTLLFGLVFFSGKL